MKCSKCNSKWESKSIFTSCPFCGESLLQIKGDNPECTFQNVGDCFKHIYSLFGKEIVLKKSLFLSTFCDLMPNCPLERNLVDTALSSGVFKQLLNLKENEILIERSRAFVILTSQYGISNKSADKVIGWILSSLYENYKHTPTAKAEEPLEEEILSDVEMYEKASYQVLEFQNGVYCGDVIAGKPHGKGTFLYSDGRKYYGSWKNGEWHGYGVYIHSNERKYIAVFKNGKWPENVVMLEPDNEIYIGSIKDFNPSSTGTLYFENGGRHESQVKDGYHHFTYLLSDGSGFSKTFDKNGMLIQQAVFDKPKK